ncbi:MAG TPA: hypothetical protein VEJ19_08180 [Nitrososphaerales archaeon]|nr:hypothetical protein [Nitrososphaerales archaeon]
MANAESGQKDTRKREDDAVRMLILRSHALTVLTFAAVILISPVSFVLGLPLGISPHSWLTTWTHWTVVLITAAFFVALFGFEGALDSRLKADRISKTISSAG